MKSIVHCRARALALALMLCTCLLPQRSAAATDVLPRIAFGSGVRESARVGVAAAVVAELLDTPQLLADVDGQRYAGDTLAGLESVVPGSAIRDRVSAVRRMLRPRDVHFDRARALEAYAAVVKSALDTLPSGRRNAFLAGELAQSIAYNARVLREAEADKYRASLAGLNEADSVAPGLGDLRAQLGKLDSGDWNESAHLATRAVAAIVGSQAAVPFPAAPTIWTIVVRSRVPEGRAAAHLALDVVWFDGHHQSFAAYPDGDDFAKNADRLTCGRDREPAAGALHVTPLVAPLDRSFDRLASSFGESCDALNARPQPYIVADASDDRFIAAMLAAAGLDPKHAMGRR